MSDATERILHKKLAGYRMQTNRQFFHLPLKDGIRIVQEVADPLSDALAGTDRPSHETGTECTSSERQESP